MKHVSLTRFGQRSESLCDLQARAQTLSDLSDQTLLPVADKWALFSQLRIARQDFGLTDRDLTVLNALLSFHPDRALDPRPGLIVFPSNATLSARAHGMAESTLRRHLARLVQSGLILRRDSPNGKRYALGRAGGQAFGFDLRPLVLHAARIADLAGARTEAEARLAARRLHLMLRLRDATGILTAAGLDDDLAGRLSAIRTRLRRQTTAALLDTIEAALDSIQPQIGHLVELGEIGRLCRPF